MIGNGERTIPEGFRALEPLEQAKLDELALKQSILKERDGRLDQEIRAAEAEIRATRLEKEAVARAIKELQAEAAAWNRAHGVRDVRTDRVIDRDGSVYIRGKVEGQQ